MRLGVLTALVMVAFAANSVLNRMALAAGEIDALLFAVYRVGSGAVALAVLVLLRDRGLALRGPWRVTGVLSLSLYMLAFSVAYVVLDAGVGALILFGGVQVTMFAGAVLAGERVPMLRWAGAGVALGGLAWLLWPGSGASASVLHAGLMLAAALGWGVYSLAGRRSGEPLKATAANFVLAAPVCLVVLWALPVSPEAVPATPRGIVLALISGVVTSALGYALWYSVLPRLAASVAAVAQLTVPVIALAGGVVLLGEAVTWSVLAASALVLGGVALGVAAPAGKGR
ncbi:MAG: DMT family transporter [Rhodobacter sp.]|nr:DMT family transporter [Rhodobacter sp.]